MGPSPELGFWEWKGWTGVSAIATALAVVVALFLAIFQDWLRQLFHRPKLTATIRDTMSCEKSVLILKNEGTPFDLYYLHLWIENEGKAAAEHAHVFASKLFRKESDGRWKELSSFLPLNLSWTHEPQDSCSFLDRLAPQTGRYCDLARIGLFKVSCG